MSFGQNDLFLNLAKIKIKKDFEHITTVELDQRLQIVASVLSATASQELLTNKQKCNNYTKG